MDWIVGVYLAFGFVKALNFVTNPNPAGRPQWAGAGAGLGTKLVYFLGAVILWPFIRSPK